MNKQRIDFEKGNVYTRSYRHISSKGSEMADDKKSDVSVPLRESLNPNGLKRESRSINPDGIAGSVNPPGRLETTGEQKPQPKPKPSR